MEQHHPPRVAAFLAALCLGALALVAAFYFRPYPVPSDPALLESGPSLRVERDALGLAFLPAEPAPGPGLLFYPGARVPPEAYAWLARGLAEAGHPTVIASFPLNFAVFAPGRAAAIIAARGGSWVVGGHSLGGAMAASWAAGNPGAVSGLLLLASYPGGGADLSGTTLLVLSVSASADGLATPAKVAAARRLLPAGTRYVEIAGGNHAQFGDYGGQPGDGAAEIPAGVQRRAVLGECSAFLAALAGR